MNGKKVNTGEIIKNKGKQYLVLSQNSEDTLMLNTLTNKFVVAWQLQEDNTWNQGYYCDTFEQASETYGKRHMERTTAYNHYLRTYSGNEACAKMRLLLEQSYRDTYDKNSDSGGVNARRIKANFEGVTEAIYEFSKCVT